MTTQINVGIAGLGTVGYSTAKQLVEKEEKLARRTGVEVRLVAVAEPSLPSQAEKHLAAQEIFTETEEMLAEADLDVFVELIGGIDPARKLIKEALSRGIDVVTANKELLAHYGREIFKHAADSAARIRFEAAVGGSIPIIRTVREAMVGADFECIYGIINGTTNYMLTSMGRRGLSFDEALTEAQNKGYAEADPSADVEGRDSAHKMTVLAELAFGISVPVENVHTEGINSITPSIMEDAERLNYSIKLLGIAKKIRDEVDVRVHPTLIPRSSALAAVNCEYNAVYIQSDPTGSAMLYGKGAGGPSTAGAVVSDIVSLATMEPNSQPAVYYSAGAGGLISTAELSTRYYLRLHATDKPGVLARVTKILGEHRISIETVLQRGRSAGEFVPVVLTTHRAREGSVQAAVNEIAQLDVIGRQPKLLRIEEDFEQQ